jgi:uncharacterized membrane protein YfhO
MTSETKEISTTKNAPDHWWLQEQKGYAILLAIFITIVSLCMSGLVRGSFPFGDITRSVNDLGNQFVPIHTYYWDMLHGKAEGDLFFNWRSAFGTGFYADFVTYLSSPFELLIYFFPRAYVNLAVYVITVLKLATAGAVMALYLSTWKHGSWLFAGLLGASYALCGWAIDDSAFVTMWLDGLIAFPLICLVGHWVLHGKRIYLGTLLVALAWISNFYTAYMATLGAAIVILIRMFTMDSTAKERGMAILRGIGMVGLGVGIALPFIYPILKATSIAQPTSTKPFVAVPWTHLFSRLFPITEGIGLSPSIFIGTPALLLAFALLFQKSVALRIRIIWITITTLVLLSFQWNPTQLLWHAFAPPNGSSFREAFVFCGMLTMLAWLNIADLKKIKPLPFIGAAIMYGLLMVITRNSPLVTDITFPIIGGVSILTVGALILIYFISQKQKFIWSGGFAGLLIIAAFVGESTVSSVMIDQIRYARFTSSLEWGKWHDQVRAEIVKNDKWPSYRTETGTNFITKNDPWLLGGQGAVYYSSLTMENTTKMLTDLGFGWDRWGRGLLSLDNEVTDAIFSIGTRINAIPSNDGALLVQSEKQNVPPLVTVRPSIKKSNKKTNVFSNQEQLLGSKVYDIPTPKISTAQGTTPLEISNTAYNIPPQARNKMGTYYLQTKCKPGSTVYLYTPYLYGTANLAGQQKHKILGSHKAYLAPIMKLGKTPASGNVSVRILTDKVGDFSKQPIACLDPVKLKRTITNLQKTGATNVETTGHTLTAALPKGITGTAILSIPHAPGWVCSTNKQKASVPDHFMGLISIPLKKDTKYVSCQYQPPGFLVGIVLGVFSVCMLLLLGRWYNHRFLIEKQ